MRDTLEFLRLIYRGAVFDEWLQLVRLRGYMQGGTLAEMLGTPRDGKPGLGDNVHAADAYLAAAEREGVIVRGRHDPTREIAFFGCGGRSVRRGRPDRWSRPVEFGWTISRNSEPRSSTEGS